ncbi:MAG: pilin [Patescibacteria group bacterium]
MKKLLLTFIIISALIPLSALAADTFGSGMLTGSAGNLGLQSDLNTGVAAVISAILAVTGTIFLVLTIVGGIIWMTASGNDEKISQAKKIIIGAAVGLAVCLFAYTITWFVANNLGNASSAGSTSGSETTGCCVWSTGGSDTSQGTMTENACDLHDGSSWSSGASC